jgi:hypothetical protein
VPTIQKEDKPPSPPLIRPASPPHPYVINALPKSLPQPITIPMPIPTQPTPQLVHQPIRIPLPANSAMLGEVSVPASIPQLAPQLVKRVTVSKSIVIYENISYYMIVPMAASFSSSLIMG